MDRKVSRARRNNLGAMLIAIAAYQEAQSLGLARLQSAHMTQLTDKERKALRSASMLIDRSNRVLRVLGNHLEQS